MINLEGRKSIFKIFTVLYNGTFGDHFDPQARPGSSQNFQNILVTLIARTYQKNQTRSGTFLEISDLDDTLGQGWAYRPVRSELLELFGTVFSIQYRKIGTWNCFFDPVPKNSTARNCFSIQYQKTVPELFGTVWNCFSPKNIFFSKLIFFSNFLEKTSVPVLIGTDL